MFIKLSRYVRVYISESQIAFIKKYKDKFPMLESRMDVEDVPTAKLLASKVALVRKKLEYDTQYALNKSMRIVK
jgi:hypothetical protein